MDCQKGLSLLKRLTLFAVGVSISRELPRFSDMDIYLSKVILNLVIFTFRNRCDHI